MGIAIAELVRDPDCVHVGILYKLDSGECRICHFGDHFDFQDHSADQTPRASQRGFRWIQLHLDPVLRHVALGILCVLIKANLNGTAISYGFLYNGEYFDPNSRAYTRSQPDGLTCATFVLAVFRNMHIEILDTATWPPASGANLEWQRRMANHLGGRFPYAHPDFLTGIGSARFKPEEVAAGAASLPKPIRFPEAERLARKVKRDLRRSYK
jgi:hypothetical protein